MCDIVMCDVFGGRRLPKERQRHLAKSGIIAGNSITEATNRALEDMEWGVQRLPWEGRKRCGFERNKKLDFFNKFSHTTGPKIWRNDNLLVNLQVKRGRASPLPLIPEQGSPTRSLSSREGGGRRKRFPGRRRKLSSNAMKIYWLPALTSSKREN